jgi:hypothetical protein
MEYSAGIGICEKMQSKLRMTVMRLDESKIDDAVLALLYLTLNPEDHRAWKSHDWEALNRLHQQELISNPATKNKSVVLTEEGETKAKALAQRLFGAD